MVGIVSRRILSISPCFLIVNERNKLIQEPKSFHDKAIHSSFMICNEEKTKSPQLCSRRGRKENLMTSMSHIFFHNEVNGVFYHAHKRSLEAFRVTQEAQQISQEGRRFMFFLATLGL